MYLANALKKLHMASQKIPMNANPATSHMFKVSPLSGGGILKLFSTHPPIEERVARLETMRLVLIIGAILVFFLFLSPWVQIGAGERGIVLNFDAVQDKVLDEGLHFRMPIMQNVTRVDVKVQKAESLRLQRANISPDLIELRKIEANLKAIDKWNGILPQVTGGGAVPFIGVGDIQKR